MVAVSKSRQTKQQKESKLHQLSTRSIHLMIAVVFYFLVSDFDIFSNDRSAATIALPRTAASSNDNESNKQNALRDEMQQQQQQRKQQEQQQQILKPLSPSECPYKNLRDLSPIERHPKATDTRHLVDPPNDKKISLVCCQTTKGPWSIAVHHEWAPRGAERFLDMVTSGYFNDRASTGGVPLFRCLEKFICQFGLKGHVPDEHPHRVFQHVIMDDPPWLPKGPAGRKNDKNVKRFAKGYFAYAGAGAATRSEQLIVALHDNGPLAGGSPWETPWGELVGEHSYKTLDQIYFGYDEKGPAQGLLMRADEAELSKVREDFPLMDYITSCDLVDDAVDS